MDINELLQKIKKADSWPTAFTKGAPLWNDDYISLHMLNAHLDDSHDKASYNSILRMQVVEEIISQCRLKKNSTILDLGCGPGLYAQEFAKRGIDYTGIDISNQSLGYAMIHKGEYQDNIHYIHDDYSTYEFQDQYDCISMIWCDFGALSPTVRDSMLNCINKTLKKDGMFCFDVFVAQSPFHEQHNSWRVERDGFWQKGLAAVLERNKYYETVGAALHMSIVASETGVKTYYIWDKRYSEKELSKVLSDAGFEVLYIKEGGLSQKQPEVLGVYCKSKHK